MRAMGVDLLLEVPLVDHVVAEGRATVWVEDAVVRARFHDAAGQLVSHDLELLPGQDPVGGLAGGRRRLLLMSSREGDVHTFAQRLGADGWREIARSRPAHPVGAGYFLALVDHPTQA